MTIEYLYVEDYPFFGNEREIYYTKEENKRLGTPCWHLKGVNGGGNTDYPTVVRYGKNVRLSRYVYELEFCTIPQGYYILHACDNPRCFNPDHLYAGTPQDNVTDMVLKGRDNFYNRAKGAK